MTAVAYRCMASGPYLSPSDQSGLVWGLHSVVQHVTILHPPGHLTPSQLLDALLDVWCHLGCMASPEPLSTFPAKQIPADWSALLGWTGSQCDYIYFSSPLGTPPSTRRPSFHSGPFCPLDVLPASCPSALFGLFGTHLSFSISTI